MDKQDVSHIQEDGPVMEFLAILTADVDIFRMQSIKMLIKLFQTDNPNYGYNIQKGGNNKKLSEETKKLISKNHADFSGKNHPMYGKHHPDATKEKIRKAKIGSKLSDATKEKISQKMKGANNPRAKKVLCIETG